VAIELSPRPPVNALTVEIVLHLNGLSPIHTGNEVVVLAGAKAIHGSY
jgi:hypothetical protein